MILIGELYILECLIPKIYYKFYTIALVYFKKLIKKESNLLLRNTEKIFMSLIIQELSFLYQIQRYDRKGSSHITSIKKFKFSYREIFL